MVIENLLAKSDGTLLIDHLRAVQKIGLLMFDKLECADISLRDEVSYGCLLHDVGKAVNGFQTYIQSKKQDGVEQSCIFHHETAWSILSTHYILSEYDFALDSIYWHHSKKDVKGIKKDYNNEIIDLLSEEDINTVNELINFLIEHKDLNNIRNKKIHIPEYYSTNEKENTKKVVVRSCVIGADRLVSSNNIDVKRIMNDDVYCESLINNLIERPSISEYDSAMYNSERFLKQVEYTNKALENKTTILKAPAGFGKTLLGLLWFTKRNRKLIWVCPRNAVASSVYESIIKELINLKIDVSVELFLTGVKQKTNKIGIEDFSSDIVVTNIDNYLFPTINNAVRNRMYNIVGSDVVFDEFHELISSDAMFGCFINIMITRNRFTNSKTLLLSATPSIIEYLWDSHGDGNKTCVLPNKDEHYNPAHDGIYIINKTNDYNSINVTEDSLTIMNSITNSQITCIEKKSDILIHSNYLDRDKTNIFSEIFKNYSTKEKVKKPSVVSAPIIQASMDISFKDLTDSVMSPESTLQRIGRCDRWGTLQNKTPTVTLFLGDKNSDLNASENSAICNNYDSILNKLWVKFIDEKIENGEKYDLKKLYSLYNEYNNVYQKEVKEYIDKNLKNSYNALCNIYPYQVIEKTGNKYKKISSKLRGNGKNIWCIYSLISDNKKVTEPFNIDYVKTTEKDEFGINNLIGRVFKIIDMLVKNGDERFKYNKFNKYVKLDKRNNNLLSDIRNKLAKNPETPYVAFNKVYSKKYGLIKTKICEKYGIKD
jgi:CRISPR-associated endonuclease Cas3-HD